MNKKQLSILLIFLACTLSVYSQKVDLDKKHFTVEYLTLPTNVTLPYFDKYSTDFFVDPIEIGQLQLKPAMINSFFQLDGYQYTKEDAEFSYSIQIGNCKVLNENIITKNETYTNSNGTTTTVTKYIATAVAVIPTKLSISLVPYGTNVYTLQFADYNDPIVYQSSPQTTWQGAQLLLSSKVGSIASPIKDTYIQLLQNKIKQLKRDCSFTKDSTNVFLLTVNEKDAVEYGKFNKSVTEATTILSNIKYNKPINEAREQMTEILNYWSECVQNVSPMEKHYKKLMYAYLWNLAICQFYLEYLNESETTCMLLKSHDHDKKDVEELLNAIAFVRESFQKSGLKSRHIDRIGFNSQEHYTYTPTVAPVQKKTNQKQ